MLPEFMSIAFHLLIDPQFSTGRMQELDTQTRCPEAKCRNRNGSESSFLMQRKESAAPAVKGR